MADGGRAAHGPAAGCPGRGRARCAGGHAAAAARAATRGPGQPGRGPGVRRPPECPAAHSAAGHGGAGGALRRRRPRRPPVWGLEHRKPSPGRAPGGALRNGRYRLRGAKTFASGAGHITRPLITGALPEGQGWQLFVLPADTQPPVLDRSFWQPLGMRATASFRADLTGLEIGRRRTHRPAQCVLPAAGLQRRGHPVCGGAAGRGRGGVRGNPEFPARPGPHR